jgi:hypothetical protein
LSKRPRWRKDEETLLRQLIEAGNSYATISHQLGRTYNSVRQKCRLMKINSIADRKPRLSSVDAPPRTPTYDEYLRLEGDWLIVADTHCPCTHWVTASRAALVAKKYLDNPRLIVAGDLMNFDMFSRFAKRVPLPALKQELDAARYAFELWSKTFNEKILILGNHDYRWMRAMDGVFEADTFIELIQTLINDRDTKISTYSYLDIDTAAGTWRVTHMPEYSKVPLSKARFLGHRLKDKHLALAHQHHATVGLDESGTCSLVDILALVDSDRLAYVGLDDSTKPQMKRGFLMIRGGYPYLFAEGLTDWDFWL